MIQQLAAVLALTVAGTLLTSSCERNNPRRATPEELSETYGLAARVDPECHLLLALRDRATLPPLAAQAIESALEDLAFFPDSSELPAHGFIAVKGATDWQQALPALRSLLSQARFFTLGGGASLSSGGGSHLVTLVSAKLDHRVAELLNDLPLPEIIIVTAPSHTEHLEQWVAARADSQGQISLADLFATDLPPGTLAAALDRTFSSTLGHLEDGSVYLTLGGKAEDFFVESPFQGATNSPRWGALAELSLKNPSAICLASSGTVEAFRKPDQSTCFWRAVGQALDALPNIRKPIQLESLKTAPSSTSKSTPFVGALLKHDSGFHIEGVGGLNPTHLNLTTKRKLAPAKTGIYRQHHVLNEDESKRIWDRRAESATTINELAVALAEARGDGSLSAFGPLANYLPTLAATSSSLRKGLSEGLHTERMIIADLGGKIPKIEALGGRGAGMPMPRIAIAHPVRNRGDLAERWSQTLTEAKSADTPLPIPPLSQGITDGKTTYHGIELPFVDTGLLPGVTLSDDLHVISTSADLADTIYEELSEGRSLKEPGANWNIDLQALAAHLTNLDPASKEQLLQFLPLPNLLPQLLQSSGQLEMELYEERGQVRRRLRLVTPPPLGEE